MFPIVLDLTRIPLLLVGQGDMVLRRLAYLDDAKARHVAVFCEDASDELRLAAGDRLVKRLPTDTHIKNYAVILVAGLERADAERIAGAARRLGKLVNVEDVSELCDFYFTANVRRGDLIIAVSTSGGSPTLARKVRDVIAERFGEEWAMHVSELSDLRRNLKLSGATMREVAEHIERFLAEKGWLSEDEEETV